MFLFCYVLLLEDPLKMMKVSKLIPNNIKVVDIVQMKLMVRGEKKRKMALANPAIHAACAAK